MSEPTTEYLVRIVYKSGYTHDFWAKSFSINTSTYEWEAADPKHRPVMLGPGEIAAIWQIDVREPKGSK